VLSDAKYGRMESQNASSMSSGWMVTIKFSVSLPVASDGTCSLYCWIKREINESGKIKTTTQKGSSRNCSTIQAPFLTKQNDPADSVHERWSVWMILRPVNT